ncbi:hypothetical protein NIB75_23795 [Bacteroides uniformis]|nr:hypothetical protein [Bacteroides uniformis]
MSNNAADNLRWIKKAIKSMVKNMKTTLTEKINWTKVQPGLSSS